MNLHRLAQYWRHRRRAKGRHGVHSPFVYRFIEEALKQPLPEEIRQQLSAGSWQDKQTTTLLYRCLKFLQPQKLVYNAIPESTETWQVILNITGIQQALVWNAGPLSAVADGLIISGAPDEWPELFEAWVALLARGSFLLITGIYCTPRHTAAWQKLCADARINLSLDLYFAGLLFYRNDFKEQQHFQLRYPL